MQQREKLRIYSHSKDFARANSPSAGRKVPAWQEGSRRGESNRQSRSRQTYRFPKQVAARRWSERKVNPFSCLTWCLRADFGNFLAGNMLSGMCITGVKCQIDPPCVVFTDSAREENLTSCGQSSVAPVVPRYSFFWLQVPHESVSVWKKGGNV